MKKPKYTPFSKKNVIYARAEAYISALILIVLIIFDKDVSAISLSMFGLFGGGYKLIQGLYMKMAEREHLEEIRQGRLYENLSTDDIDMEISDLEQTPVNKEDYDY